MRVMAGAVAALLTVGGSLAQDLDVVSDSGLVSVEWDSVPGVAYRLQNNADLASGWTNVDGGAWSYGLGQQFSYGVYAYDAGSGTPPVPNPPSSAHTFAITGFAAQGKILASWQGDNGGQALIDSSQLPASLPPALALQVPDGQGGFYALTVVQVSVTWQPAFLTDAFLVEANLSPDQLLELAKLTGAYSEIQSAINGGGGSSQTSVAAQAGDRFFFQLEIAHPDSDGDGLVDSEELALGIDAFHPDSDRDGFLDSAETQLGTDPSDPASAPSMATPGAGDLLQEGIVKLTGGSSSLTICCTYGGATWELSRRSGPANFTMPFSRGVLYEFKLGADTAAPAAIDLQPQPGSPGTWSWWVEVGDGQAAGGTSSPTGDHPTAKALLPVEIVPDDGQVGVTGDLIPSVNGPDGDGHYVSPKKSEEIPDDYVVLKAPGYDDAKFDELLEWEGGEAVPGESTKRQVKRDAAGRTAVKLKVKATGEVAQAMNVWVVWCETTAQPGTAEFFHVTQGGEYLGSRAGVAKLPASELNPARWWRFSFRILPPLVITAEERPNLHGENESPVPSEGGSDGEGEVYHIVRINSLAGSASTKWDVSRAMQVTINNPNLIPEATLKTSPAYGNLFKNQTPPKESDQVVVFPVNPVMGNDDSDVVLDEDTNPYAASAHLFLGHPVGEITSIDAPWLDFDKRWGADGHRFGIEVSFREFARVELWDGEREGATWFRISDYHDWHFVAEAKFDDPLEKWNDDGTATGNGHDL